MIHFIEEADGKTGVLKLEGDVTVQQAEELKETLIRGFGSVENVYVDSSKAAGIDLSCLQLLCAAHRAAETMHKSFQLAEPVPDHFRRIAGAAGFARHTGCRFDVTGTCIWAGLSGSRAGLS